MNNSKITFTSYIFPDNVHKHIAQFLKGKEIKCNITLIQNGGCPEGYHKVEEAYNCYNCSNIYNQNEIYILLKKGGNKVLFNYFVNKIKNKLTNKNQVLKGDYSRWKGIGEKGTPWKMGDLLTNINISENIFKGPVLLKPWENEIYEEKYIFSGLYYALFYSLIKELHPISNFDILGGLRTKCYVTTSSFYYDVIGTKYIKNQLCAVNKLYNKYTLAK